jgi:hypothetical protein
VARSDGPIRLSLDAVRAGVLGAHQIVWQRKAAIHASSIPVGDATVIRARPRWCSEKLTLRSRHSAVRFSCSSPQDGECTTGPDDLT